MGYSEYPKVCNLCGGKVVYIENSKIYGKKIGSGYCYYCVDCHAYTGTHKPWPRVAMGILADKHMRTMKTECHEIFDSFWHGKSKAQKKRNDLYAWLAREMGIPFSECHFGYFDKQQLKKALRILMRVQHKRMKYDNNGRVYFV